MAKIEMKPMGPAKEAAAATPQTNFQQAAGRRLLIAPRNSRVKAGDDEDAVYLKLLIFGDSGTGKTYSVKGLLELGYKVLVVTTDLGGDGTLAFKIPLRMEGKAEVLKRLRTLVLQGYNEVDQFLHEPAAFFPEIYEWDPDVVVWDGFSAFQQVDISEYVGGMPSLTTNTDKELPAAVEAGLFMAQPQWNMIKNATMRALDRFLDVHNKKTGKVWHKIITCLEGLKQKEGSREYAETKEPLLQGVAGRMSNAGFDLVMRTKKRMSRDETTKALKTTYWFQIAGENARAKSRGFQLEAEEPADMCILWAKLATQAGIHQGAVDVSKIAPVDVSPAAVEVYA